MTRHDSRAFLTNSAVPLSRPSTKFSFGMAVLVDATLETTTVATTVISEYDNCGGNYIWLLWWQPRGNLGTSVIAIGSNYCTVIVMNGYYSGATTIHSHILMASLFTTTVMAIPLFTMVSIVSVVAHIRHVHMLGISWVVKVSIAPHTRLTPSTFFFNNGLLSQTLEVIKKSLPSFLVCLFFKFFCFPARGFCFCGTVLRAITPLALPVVVPCHWCLTHAIAVMSCHWCLIHATVVVPASLMPHPCRCGCLLHHRYPTWPPWLPTQFLVKKISSTMRLVNGLHNWSRIKSWIAKPFRWVPSMSKYL